VLTKQEKLARLRIIRSETVGIATFWRMIKLYGSGERALQAIPILSKSSKKTFNLCSEEKILEELHNLKSSGVRLAFFEDDLYPPPLRNIPDPPPVLAFLGNKEAVLSLYKKNIISVVGARNASIHAARFCTMLCEKLNKEDVVIVSGLARGIDTCAHNGGIENGTIAVLAGGINIVYPLENLELYKKISEKWGIFAEMPHNTFPQPQLFPRRNRVIAGMSYGTVVIEAAENSGSLITARFALEYNRDVFAVPGFPLDPRSIGCNTLLKEGAILVQSAQDVLDYIENRKIINPSLFEEGAPFIAKISDQDLEKTRKKILNSLSTVPITIDELISSLKESPQEVLIALLELELASKITRLHGQRVCLSLTN
jgi:DNA processing protein